MSQQTLQATATQRVRRINPVACVEEIDTLTGQTVHRQVNPALSGKLPESLVTISDLIDAQELEPEATDGGLRYTLHQSYMRIYLYMAA